MDDQQRRWVDRIRAGDEEAFRAVFDTYYEDLCRFASQFVSVPSHARDIVQQVFLKIWESRSEWTVHTSLKAYLYQSVRNRALNSVRRDRASAAMEDRLKEASSSAQERTAEDRYRTARLREQIDAAIARLPTRQKTAFLLQRRHGLSYREIAAVMDITPKTVENHIGRALQFLREELAEYRTESSGA
jgi:RNA polymerase sigma-70 factor (ECF subfamily)